VPDERRTARTAAAAVVANPASETRGTRSRAPSRVRTSPRGQGVAAIAMWPLDATDGYPSSARDVDPWARLVREAIELYRTGRADAARQMWTDDIVWRVIGDGPPSGEHRGADAIFAHHRRLARLTDETFRQQLIAVEGSGGPVVTAYVRTRAQRGTRSLDIPSLVSFEVSRMHIQRVVELPGDLEAWNRFWAR
jgi:ketosteroid isomerase-like protein